MIIMTKQASQSKEGTKLLSIIIPTLYQNHYYEDIIQNLTDLWYWSDNPDIEIITIENKLVNDAWNEWVEKSIWKYVLIINDDIIIYKDTIQKLMHLADIHKVACPYYTRADNNQKILSSTGKRVIWFCFMIKRDNLHWLFPIPNDLRLWYWDDWLFWKADMDMWLWGLIHHWESKTILSPEHRKKCDNIIAWDKYIWESFYKFICR